MLKMSTALHILALTPRAMGNHALRTARHKLSSAHSPEDTLKFCFLQCKSWHKHPRWRGCHHTAGESLLWSRRPLVLLMCQNFLHQACLGAIRVLCSSSPAEKSISQARASILGLWVRAVSNDDVESSKLVLCFPRLQESLTEYG